MTSSGLCTSDPLLLQGDSGGPLVALQSGSEPQQIGIVSWGEGCALPGKYGVYANVRNLRAFLIRTVPDIQTWSPFPEGQQGTPGDGPPRVGGGAPSRVAAPRAMAGSAPRRPNFR